MGTFEYLSLPSDITAGQVMIRVATSIAALLIVLLDAAPGYPLKLKRFVLISVCLLDIVVVLQESGIGITSATLVAHQHCAFNFCYDTRSMFIAAVTNLNVIMDASLVISFILRML
jgi:predicted neutral ceramidase superfamily lipid hydrolase